MSENIQIVKLVNSELIIGNVSEDSDGVTLTINKPYLVGIRGEQIGFVNFCDQFTADEDITIKQDKVLYVSNPNQELYSAYIRHTLGTATTVFNENLDIKTSEKLDISDLTSL